MKKIYILFLVALVLSCTKKKKYAYKEQHPQSEREVVVSAFQTFIDSANVKGSMLVYNLKDDTYYSNDFNWATKGNLPASTYKITNSIIALETGVVQNDSTLFIWNGEKRGMKVWERDMIFKEAFHYSCVPCYQEIARKIGATRMNTYLDKLNYGKMDVDTTNIDLFWLEGKSQINQYQQIDFLKRLYTSALPISKRTETIMKRMMVIEEHETYTLSGKTGWSIRNGNNNGWFVGFVALKENTYFFATNIEPNQKFNMDMFPMIRKELTFKALEHLGVMN